MITTVVCDHNECICVIERDQLYTCVYVVRFMYVFVYVGAVVPFLLLVI